MNLGEHLLACAERRPEALAIVDGERRATYAELLERGALGGRRPRRRVGVGPGDRVAAALKNRIETAVLYWASQWLGAVFVPLNWRLRPDELTLLRERLRRARCSRSRSASAEAAAAVPGTPLIAIAGRRPQATARARLDGPAAPSRADDARAGADALHLGHDRAARRACRARTAPSARRRSRSSCSSSCARATARSA